MAQQRQQQQGIPVCFDERMVVRDNPSFSPSAGKPAEVVAAWGELRDVESGAPLIRIEAVEPVTPEQIALAHAPDYVEAILAGRRPNGFANRSLQVARSLAWTVGAMVSASFVACEDKRYPAVAPVSGFHHATYRRAMGFCTFNGLIVAAQLLRQHGLAKRVGILDLDVHYGNGTDDIIAELGLDRWLHHWTLGHYYSQPSQSERFFARFPEVLRSFDECDLILAQMGADAWIDDPTGGIFTTEQMRQRDRLVFEHFAATNQPVAWNLAGGYARNEEGSIAPVLHLHTITLQECHRANQRHG